VLFNTYLSALILNKMAIEANKVVTLNYKLSNHKTGEKIEETSPEHPMVFLFGTGAVIPEFEINLHGKNIGETFEFSIESANAYGNPNPNEIVQIPVDAFLDEDGNMETEYVYVGAVVPMNDEEGNQLTGTVLAITNTYVEMDFNHPLAGTDLKFEGEIVGIREATTEELAHGHAHGADGQAHH
jgi:FKBP-type peptidyl-prolyl cis-trans isomerase SlyD